MERTYKVKSGGPITLYKDVDCKQPNIVNLNVGDKLRVVHNHLGKCVHVDIAGHVGYILANDIRVTRG